MAFKEIDTSCDSGAIVELYEFSTVTRVWRYTTHSEVLQTQNNFYPLPIQRKKIDRTKNLLKAEVAVNLPRDVEIAIEAMEGTIDEIITLRVWQVHLSDLSELRFTFKGRYTNHEMDGNEITLNFEPLTTTMKRLGFRAKYQRICRHVLYGGFCGASTANHVVTGLVQAISVNEVKVEEVGSNINAEGVELGYPDSYFTAGYIVTANGSKRMILKHTGNTLRLLSPISSLELSQTISVYAGCDHTFETCRDKFNNFENYGGFDDIPSINPYTGTRIF